MNNKKLNGGQLLENLIAYEVAQSACDNPLKNVRGADRYIGYVTSQLLSKDVPEYKVLQTRADALLDLYRICTEVKKSKVLLTETEKQELECYEGRALRGIDTTLREALKGYEEQNTRSTSLQSFYNLEFCTMDPEQGYVPRPILEHEEDSYHATRMGLNKTAAALRGYFAAIRTLFEGKAKIDFNQEKRTPEDAKEFNKRVDYYFLKLIEPTQLK